MDFLRINSRDEPLGIGDGAGRFQEPGGRWQGNRVSLRVTSAAKVESVGVLLIRGGQPGGSLPRPASTPPTSASTSSSTSRPASASTALSARPPVAPCTTPSWSNYTRKQQVRERIWNTSDVHPTCSGSCSVFLR